MTARRSRRVGIIGTGLIGTSAGLALRAAGWQVSGYDQHAETAGIAAGMGAIERRYRSVQALAKAVDLVIVAVPPAATIEVCRVALAAGARAVTDVASVKGPIVRELGEEPAFLGGHPMAGSERGGPAAASKSLFDRATWVLTRTAATDPGTVDLVTTAVQAVGARPLTLDAADHDRMVAASSHAPHAMAVALVLALADAPDSAAIAQVMGGGWQSGTRVACGDPDLWTDIFITNAPEMMPALNAVIGAAVTIREAVRSVDAVELRRLLHQGADLCATLKRQADDLGRAAG